MSEPPLSYETSKASWRVTARVDMFVNIFGVDVFHGLMSD
jgi:hypothetical protein